MTHKYKNTVCSVLTEQTTQHQLTSDPDSVYHLFLWSHDFYTPESLKKPLWVYKDPIGTHYLGLEHTAVDTRQAGHVLYIFTFTYTVERDTLKG